MHVFVITASWISEHTVMTEVAGVYAHVYQTTARVHYLKNVEHKSVLVTKHEVIEYKPDRVGNSAGANFPGPALCHGSGWHDASCRHREGVQTDPASEGIRALGRGLLAS